MVKFYTIIIFIALFFGSPALLANTHFQRTQLLMGDVLTSITIDTQSTNQTKANLAMEKAFSEAKSIEKIVSEFNPASITSQLNKSDSQEWVKIDKNLMEILVLSYEVSHLSDGAFDITYSSANQNSTYRDVFVDTINFRAKLNQANMTIVLSGIAKGYIVDRMSRVLDEAGFKHYLINAGGDLLAKGPWDISIQNPYNNGTLCDIQLNNQAAATSGLYERGKHIQHPTQGMKMADFDSVTVISSSTSLADGLATAAFVMGRKPIEEKMGQIPHTAFIFIKDHEIEQVGGENQLCQGHS